MDWFFKNCFYNRIIIDLEKFVEKEVFEIIFNELLVKGFIKSSIFVSKD